MSGVVQTVQRWKKRSSRDSRSGLGSEFGFDCLRLAEEVILDEFVDVVFIFRDQDRLTIRVVLRSACPTAHLFHFEDRNSCEAKVDVEPVQVSDDYAPSRKIDAR